MIEVDQRRTILKCNLNGDLENLGGGHECWSYCFVAPNNFPFFPHRDWENEIVCLLECECEYEDEVCIGTFEGIEISKD